MPETPGDGKAEVPDSIQDAINNNLGEAGGTYGPGNQCDDWCQDVLDEAGVNTDDVFAGSASQKSVTDHINAVTDAGIVQDNPDENWNIVYMDNSPKDLDPHSGILHKETDGSVDFYDQSSGNPNQQPDKESYDSQEDFENAFAYDDFHYVPVSPE